MISMDDVTIYKDSLKDYSRFLKRLNYYKLLMVEVEYKQQGVTGIDTAKEPSASGIDRDRIITYYSDRIDKLQELIDKEQSKVDDIELVLNIMEEEDKEMILDIYVNGVGYKDMSIRKNYSESGLKKRVNSIIKSALSTLYFYDNMVIQKKGN